MKCYGEFLPCSLTVIILCLLVSVSQSYEENHHATHSDSGYGWMKSGGSAYHYHVPLVGQNYAQPPPYYHHQPESNNNHHIYLLLAGFALLAIPLLFLTLLPLLLAPLALPILLALLMPMPMMMMIMMEMMMMSPAGGVRTETHLGGKTGTTAMRSVKEIISNDLASFFTQNYPISHTDLQNCDSRIMCELGVTANKISENSTKLKFKNILSASENFMSLFLPNILPDIKSKSFLKIYKDAFLDGANSNNCLSYECSSKYFNKTLNPAPMSESSDVDLDLNNSQKYSKYWDGNKIDKKLGKVDTTSQGSYSNKIWSKLTPSGSIQSKAKKFYKGLLGTTTIKL